MDNTVRVDKNLLMAQNIGILLIDESGKTIEGSALNFAGAQQRLVALAEYEDKFPLLSGIDEYGDTYFNAVQRPRVVQELEKLKSDFPDLKDLITKVVSLIEQAGVHEYIKFVGD